MAPIAPEFLLTACCARARIGGKRTRLDFPPAITYRSQWVLAYIPLALAMLIVSTPDSAARAQSLAATPSPAVSGAADHQPAGIDDKQRSYRREEIIATIPADDHYKFPLRLTALLPLLDSNFLVTRHQGEARPDRLALWKRADNGSYQLLEARYCDAAAPEESFESPVVIEVDKQGSPPGLKLLYIVKSGSRKPVEMPFVVDSERMELAPAGFESPKPDQPLARALTQSHQAGVWLQQGQALQETSGHLQAFGALRGANSAPIEVGTVKFRSGTYRLIGEDERRDDGELQPKWRLAPTPSTSASPRKPAQ